MSAPHTRHVVLVTYGEPTEPGFVGQLVYSWRILVGLTRTVAPIPLPLLPLIAVARARNRTRLWTRHKYGSPLEAHTEGQAAALTAALETGPLNGTLVFNSDGSFTYTPNTGFTGTDSFTYTASDGIDDSNVATATITVNPVNDAPLAHNDAYSVGEDNTLTTTGANGVLLNDFDVEGDSLTAVLVAAPSSGSLTLNADGSFTYTPNADFFGVDWFTYTASDGALSSAEVTAVITVDPVNDVPRRTIIKTTDPDRYGIRTADYFI